MGLGFVALVPFLWVPTAALWSARHRWVEREASLCMWETTVDIAVRTGTCLAIGTAVTELRAGTSASTRVKTNICMAVVSDVTSMPTSLRPWATQYPGVGRIPPT
jgi:hypothetical protein